MTRYNELKEHIKNYEKVVVAFSGGIDSYFVLKASIDSLGKNNVKAVTGVSPSLKDSEKNQTKMLASQIGADYTIIYTEELENPDYYNNPFDRCFFCKQELYTKMKVLKDESGFKYILDGTNYDDFSDYRPGYKATKNNKVLSPLANLKFTKNEIRKISKTLGLEIWNKPSSPCLASRIPYGQKVTLVKLTLIEQAEEVLKNLGFNEYRVRHFEYSQDGNSDKVLKLAKVDLPDFELRKAMDETMFKNINAKLKEIGYDFVTLDMGGLRSGSLNIKIDVINKAP
jgi:uncharacterized protein